MLEPTLTDVLTFAVSQQSFDFLIKRVFVSALALFAAFGVLALLALAAHRWERTMEPRRAEDGLLHRPQH